MAKKIEWFGTDELPPPSIQMRSFSIDVLAYFPELDQRTIAWFDFTNWKWMFLCDEELKGREFKWRHFCPKLDSFQW